MAALNTELIAPLRIYLQRHLLSSLPLAHPSTSFNHTQLQPRPCQAVTISAGSAPGYVAYRNPDLVHPFTLLTTLEEAFSEFMFAIHRPAKMPTLCLIFVFECIHACFIRNLDRHVVLKVS